MQQLPCIEVSQLAPATSFYAAVLQPLGLRYLTAESLASGPDFATFGCCQGPVLNLRQIARPTALRLSSIRISAPSPASILAFHRQGTAANPTSMFTSQGPANPSAVFDLDGNMLQAICTGHVCKPDPVTGQFALILNSQPEPHASRVLDWNRGSPEASGVKAIEGAGSAKDASANPVLPEGADATKTKTEDSGTPSSGGVSTVLSALLGVAAGAAAGAAITYGVMSARKPEMVPADMDARQRSFPSDAESVSPSMVDRDQQMPVPVRQRITFQDDQASTILKKPPTEAPVSVCPPPSVRQPPSVRAPASNCPPALVRPSLSTCPPPSVRPPPSVCPASSVCAPASVRPASSVCAPASVRPASSVCAPASVRPASSVCAPASVRPASSVCAPASVRPASSICAPASVRPPTSTCAPSPTRAPTSVHESDAVQTCSKGAEIDGQKDNEKELANVSPAKPSSTVSTSMPIGSDFPRQLVPPPPSKPSSEAGANVADSQSLKKDYETVVSAHSRISSASTAPGQASKRSSDYLKVAASTVSKAPSDSPSKHGSRQRSTDEKSCVSERSSHSRPKEVPSPKSRSPIEVSQRSSRTVVPDRPSASEDFDTRSNASAYRSSEDKRSHVSARDVPLPPSVACTSHVSARDVPLPPSVACTSHVSARDVPLPASIAGTSEFFDTRSHASARRTDVSTTRRGSEDKRSHVSAKDVPLPPSVAGTSEFFDTQSRASDRKSVSTVRPSGNDKRSHISAKDVPLPPSVAGTSEFFDTQSRASDRKSVSTIRLSGDDKRSHASARNVPLPPSVAGTSEFLDMKSCPPDRKSLSTARPSGEDKRSHVSARNVPLPPSQAVTNEFFDTQSHSSAKRTDISARHNYNSEDKRSRVSARNFPLPPSQAGTGEFFDTQSHSSAKGTDVSASHNCNGDDKRSRVSAREVPLPASRVGTSEFFDSVTHVSSRKTDVSARRRDVSTRKTDVSSRKTDVSTGRDHGDDKRSRVSARDVPLPGSRVGTSEFFDTVSHVSTIKAHSSTSRRDTASVEDSHSRVSAPNVPLPGSCVGGGSRVGDSQVSARHIPLPASSAGTNYGDGPPSHISARNIPLPGSHVGSSRANWDDDLRSVAPSDSISCVGAK